jgi:hypothetical protein
VISAETNLNIPPAKSDRAHKMLQHGRSIDEVAEATKSSPYLARRLRQEVMAAQILKRNRKEPYVNRREVLSRPGIGPHPYCRRNLHVRTQDISGDSRAVH